MRLIHRVVRNIIVRLALYYTAIAVAFMGLFSAFPQIIAYMNTERLRGEGVSIDLDPNQMVRGAEQQLRATDYSVLDPYSSVPVMVALLSVIALTIPVGWVYRWTRHPARYNSSIAHALLVLPIAIALVVFLVKGSLALAFSLAGIVAAVRFRTALSESEDAVFMFVVIGIGLAAGVQLTTVAFIASAFFNFVALLTWYLNWGSQPAALVGWSMVPAEKPRVEDVSPVVNETLDESRYNSRLRLPTTDPEATQKSVMPLLDNAAKSWRFSQTHREKGQTVIEYDLRLKKSVDVARFVRDLEDASPDTGRVELKRIKREKPAADPG